MSASALRDEVVRAAQRQQRPLVRLLLRHHGAVPRGGHGETVLATVDPEQDGGSLQGHDAKPFQQYWTWEP